MESEPTQNDSEQERVGSGALFAVGEVLTDGKPLMEQAEDDGIPIECPHCHTGFHMSPSACVPSEQVMYLAMESESAFFPADIIGKQIVNMEKLLRSVADSAGSNVVVFIKSIELEPSKVKIGFLVLDAPDRPNDPDQATARKPL